METADHPKGLDFQVQDILPSTPKRFNYRTHMDLSPCVLSASPRPASRPVLSIGLFGYTRHTPSNLEIISPSDQNSNNRYFPSLTMSKSGHSKLTERRRRISSPESPRILASPLRKPKKVSFADHKGLALAQVRIFKESPDELPELRTSPLSSLTLSADEDVAEKPIIRLCFPQPAADFLAFRDKITKNLVSLENVILKDYRVKGTIKVKNVSSTKRVFVRFSSDEWETSKDYKAAHVPGPSQGFPVPYNTFTFSIDITPSFDISKKLQFAVCFEECGSQHWDNNDGSNYTIVSEHYDAHTQ